MKGQELARTEQHDILYLTTGKMYYYARMEKWKLSGIPHHQQLKNTYSCPMHSKIKSLSEKRRVPPFIERFDRVFFVFIALIFDIF